MPRDARPSARSLNGLFGPIVSSRSFGPEPCDEDDGGKRPGADGHGQRPGQRPLAGSDRRSPLGVRGRLAYDGSVYRRRPPAAGRKRPGDPAGGVERDLDVDRRALELARRDHHLLVGDGPDARVRAAALERARLARGGRPRRLPAVPAAAPPSSSVNCASIFGNSLSASQEGRSRVDRQLAGPVRGVAPADL